MLMTGLLAAVEAGLNRVLVMDATAMPRLHGLTGKVIAVQCQSPELCFYLLPSGDGLQIAGHWEAEVDCRLSAPATRLLQLAFSSQKTRVLHSDDLSLEGDSAALMQLAEVLQDLELDWEYELSRWLGPVAAALLAGHLRSRTHWAGDSLSSLRLDVADYLSEEARSLVGRQEAHARFAEIDHLKLALARLDARIERLASSHKSDA